MRVIKFNGLYNRQKAKLMLLLCQEPSKWFTPREIVGITSISLSTARAQCRRLYAIKPPYLKRRNIGIKWQPCYEYQIGQRGLRWLEYALQCGMPRDEIIDEISVYQKGLSS